MQQYSTWLEIDLAAIQNNVRQMRTISGRAVLAVIKANGYGHGIVETARAARAGGAAWLGVARINEAFALREAGIDMPVLVLGYCPPEWVARAIQERIHLTVHHPDLGAAFSAQAVAAGGELGIHAKLDTGMGRLGVFPEDGVSFLRDLREAPGLRVEGVFTHLARADEPGLDTTDAQLNRFDILIEALQAQGMRPALVHAANSAAALYYARARYDMVRPGIAIYGLHPSADAPLPDGFRPALAWKARLVSVKNLPAGHGVGYNFRYITQRDERIGVIPVGYADGFRRRLGNFALVDGKRVPVIGGVCMDQCMLQLDTVPEARTGDVVVLIGAQGEARITAEDLGAAWGTVNYEVVCGLAARVPRVYYEGDGSSGKNQTMESA